MILSFQPLDFLRSVMTVLKSFNVSSVLGFFQLIFVKAGLSKPSYEFYNPSAAARQLGLGQLPIKLYFADKLRPREYIKDGIKCNKISQLVLAIPRVDPSVVVCGLFSSNLFN